MASAAAARPLPGYRANDPKAAGAHDALDGAGDKKSLKDRALDGFNKFNNDWTMNLVAMVAYNVLTSFFPLLLALLTLLVLLPVVSDNIHSIAIQLNQILPSNVRDSINVESLIKSVHSAGGILTVISIATLLWGGSNLIGSIESAFAVIYRVKTRDIVPQKLMSLVMILLLAVLLPLSFASSLILTMANTTLSRIVPSVLSGPVGQVIGYATSLSSLFLLFAAIYIIIPNIPVPWHDAWHGALFGAIGMFVINTIFPFYTAKFVSTAQYSKAALAGSIILITWFWFFSLILLIGAEINSLAMGLGPWPFDITRMLMDYKLPAEEGAASAMQTQRGRKERNALPFSGLVRDSQNVHDQVDRRTGKVIQRQDGKDGPSGTQRGDKRLGRGKAKGQDGPFPARVMAPDLVATGITEGGVKMATPRSVFGEPDGPPRALVIFGAVLGLLGGLLGVLRRR